MYDMNGCTNDNFNKDGRINQLFNNVKKYFKTRIWRHSHI